jgi:hypothetical protein
MFKKLALSLLLVASFSAQACPPTAFTIAGWVISSAAAYAAPVAKAAVIAAIKVVLPMPSK